MFTLVVEELRTQMETIWQLDEVITNLMLKEEREEGELAGPKGDSHVLEARIVPKEIVIVLGLSTGTWSHRESTTVSRNLALRKHKKLSPGEHSLVTHIHKLDERGRK